MLPTFIALCLVVVMIVGPIMMVQPSRYQKRLARLRTLAAKRGLRVRLGQNPAPGEPRQLAIYSHAIETNKRLQKIPTWSLARQTLEHELNFATGWDWLCERQAPKVLHEPIQQWLMALPASIRVVEVTEHSVGVYWTESCWHKEPRWELSVDKCLNDVDQFLHRLTQIVDAQ